MPTLKEIQSAYTHQAIAKIFDVPEQHLLSGLYGYNGYETWLVPKKSGGYRVIASPRHLRRHIQKRLKEVLEGVYKVPKSVHGFVGGKSIVSNAFEHVAKKTVINLDLSNCFDTINFYRIRGLFLSHPLSFPWVAANILAHACTRDQCLPAGGITSPIITNLILSSLDKRLALLVGKQGGTYTRYADDITISFPFGVNKLSEFTQIDVAGKYEIAQKLASELTAEGFESNPLKFRVATGASRKMVTGLVVNERVNLPRRWMRRLECEVYATEKFGMTHVLGDYLSNETDQVREIMALRRIHGKIAYASMVRGRNDWVVAGLANRLNRLHDKKFYKLPDVELISRDDRLRLGLWVVAAGGLAQDFYDPPNGNGTGFTTDQGFVVTAYHVIVDKEGKLLPKITIRREKGYSQLLDCELVAGSSHTDLALLKPIKSDHSQTRVRFRLGLEPKHNSLVTSAGYPDYFPGHFAAFQSHQVIGTIIASAVRKIRINGEVSGGMSGGPILDKDLNVVGVIHRGKSNKGFANEAISVSHLNDLVSSVSS